jgi:hypothetical protein
MEAELFAGQEDGDFFGDLGVIEFGFEVIEGDLLGQLAVIDLAAELVKADLSGKIVEADLVCDLGVIEFICDVADIELASNVVDIDLLGDSAQTDVLGQGDDTHPVGNLPVVNGVDLAFDFSGNERLKHAGDEVHAFAGMVNAWTVPVDWHTSQQMKELSFQSASCGISDQPSSVTWTKPVTAMTKESSWPQFGHRMPERQLEFSITQ